MSHHQLVLPPLPAVTEVRGGLTWKTSWGPAPRWATPRSPERPTYGPVVARIARKLGMPLMPWQRYVIDVMHEVDPVTGFWVYDEVVVTVPRQAGKTTLKIPVYVHRLGSIRRWNGWMTAQNGGKALDRWNSSREWMEEAPELAGKIKSKVSIGHEEIRWKSTNGVLRPFTPNGEAMHGESPDLVDVDEWFAFGQVEAEALTGAYEPGFLTRNAQAFKTSTQGTDASYGLNKDTRLGREAVELGRRSGTAYFEWSLEDEVAGVPIEELPDEDLVAACIAIHPAVGFHPTAPAERLQAKIAGYLLNKKLERAEYIRAFGNRRKNEGRPRLIPEPAVVASMEGTRPIPKDARVPVGFGIAVDQHESVRDAAIAAAYRAPDGTVTVEIIRHQSGADWLPAAMIGLAGTWNHTQIAGNNAGATRDSLDRIAGLEPLALTMSDYAAACARVHRELVTVTPRPTFRHIGQAPLTLAMEVVGRRRVGQEGGWAWLTSESCSIAALEAATVAVWAADHPRETEPDPGQFWIA